MWFEKYVENVIQPNDFVKMKFHSIITSLPLAGNVDYITCKWKRAFSNIRIENWVFPCILEYELSAYNWTVNRANIKFLYQNPQFRKLKFCVPYKIITVALYNLIAARWHCFGTVVTFLSRLAGLTLIQIENKRLSLTHLVK